MDDGERYRRAKKAVESYGGSLRMHARSVRVEDNPWERRAASVSRQVRAARVIVRKRPLEPEPDVRLSPETALSLALGMSWRDTPRRITFAEARNLVLPHIDCYPPR